MLQNLHYISDILNKMHELGGIYQKNDCDDDYFLLAQINDDKTVFSITLVAKSIKENCFLPKYLRATIIETRLTSVLTPLRDYGNKRHDAKE